MHISVDPHFFTILRSVFHDSALSNYIYAQELLIGAKVMATFSLKRSEFIRH